LEWAWIEEEEENRRYQKYWRDVESQASNAEMFRRVDYRRQQEWLASMTAVAKREKRIEAHRRRCLTWYAKRLECAPSEVPEAYVVARDAVAKAQRALERKDNR
jgi:hypothetical protein